MQFRLFYSFSVGFICGLFNWVYVLDVLSHYELFLDVSIWAVLPAVFWTLVFDPASKRLMFRRAGMVSGYMFSFHGFHTSPLLSAFQNDFRTKRRLGKGTLITPIGVDIGVKSGNRAFFPGEVCG